MKGRLAIDKAAAVWSKNGKRCVYLQKKGKYISNLQQNRNLIMDKNDRDRYFIEQMEHTLLDLEKG